MWTDIRWQDASDTRKGGTIRQHGTFLCTSLCYLWAYVFFFCKRSDFLKREMLNLFGVITILAVLLHHTAGQNNWQVKTARNDKAGISCDKFRISTKENNEIEYISESQIKENICNDVTRHQIEHNCVDENEKQSMISKNSLFEKCMLSITETFLTRRRNGTEESLLAESVDAAGGNECYNYANGLICGRESIDFYQMLILIAKKNPVAGLVNKGIPSTKGKERYLRDDPNMQEILDLLGEDATTKL